jgi:hypothetical protein
MKIFVSILAIDREINICTAKMLLLMAADPRAQVEFFFVQHAPVDSARNAIVERFLESDADYLISVDDDTGCDKNPIDLCFLGKDIIYLPTAMIQEGKLKINVHYLGEGEGLQEVGKGGTGCFILSKHAAKSIPKPLFKFEYDEKGDCTLGEDYYFSEKAKEYFTLYAHKDYPCHHVKGLDLLSLFPKK